MFRVGGEMKSRRRYGRETIGVNHVQTLLFLARIPRPRRAARRVTGCEVRGDRRISQRDLFAVTNFTSNVHLRKFSRFDVAELRIVGDGETLPQSNRTRRAH
jgi:hypothetical protein